MLAAALSFVSVPAWAGLIAIAYVAWAFRRGGGATAITLLQEANRVLEKRVHDLEAQAKNDAALIAELRTHTDITLALKPLLAWTESHEAVDAIRFQAVEQRTKEAFEETALRIETTFERHEVRAQEQQQRTLDVLELIASRLG